MTEPSPAGPGSPAEDEPARAPEPSPGTEDAGRFADLDQRPVAEHVAVFEAEHDRLQRELGTIDPP